MSVACHANNRQAGAQPCTNADSIGAREDASIAGVFYRFQRTSNIGWVTVLINPAVVLSNTSVLSREWL